MYAVFADGSRQYRVSEGDRVKVDFRDGDKGAAVTFERVLLFRNGDELKIGRPVLDGTRILAEFADEPYETSTKLYVQHFRRRKNYRRFKGHRQPYRLVQIKHILQPGQEPPAAPPPESTTEPAAGG